MISAIKTIVDKNIEDTVKALSVKFSFDLADAIAFVNEMSVVEEKSKKTKKVKKAVVDPDEPVKKAVVDPDEPVEEQSKKTKKVKKVVDPDKPKRAATGYLTYSKEMRQQVKASLTAKLEGDAKLKPQDIVRELGASWKSLSEDEQKEWNDKAKSASSSSGSDDE